MSKMSPKQKPQTKTDFIAQIAKKITVSKKEADRLVTIVLETL
jgi:nucleoid DNA-binding protein